MSDMNLQSLESSTFKDEQAQTFAVANVSHGPVNSSSQTAELFKSLSILDRLLTPAILVCMIIGVVIGNFAPGVQEAFNTVRLKSVSVPIAVGLLVMMWPVLTKVRYETLPTLFASRAVWIHISISMFLNWIIGPLVMVALAWATLPDLPTYRTGVIMVGLARCIAMVMIWNQLAQGNPEYCAVLVVINSVLQIILYSPYALLFINIVGGKDQTGVKVSYGDVAISVLIVSNSLGIPLLAGILTRYGVWYCTSKAFLYQRFLPLFSPLALIGLLYTIIVMFAYQGRNIIHHLGTSYIVGPVFRVFVPLILYFIVMWSSAFAFVFWLHRKESRAKNPGQVFGYDMAVVQAFTAGSNNFELAIAVAIAVYGVGSDQALAATIGPLVEVPVLLALTWVALWIRDRVYHVDTTGVKV